MFHFLIDVAPQFLVAAVMTLGMSRVGIPALATLGVLTHLGRKNASTFVISSGTFLHFLGFSRQRFKYEKFYIFNIMSDKLRSQNARFFTSENVAHEKSYNTFSIFLSPTFHTAHSRGRAKARRL